MLTQLFTSGPYVLSRNSFDALAATVAERIPALDCEPAVDDEWRYGAVVRCLAISCPPGWTAYAALLTATTLLADQPDPQDDLLDATMRDLATGQHVYIDSYARHVVYWPTITVSPR